jgi:predicted nucleic-acid-binding Zn-ribbon protein
MMNCVRCRNEEFDKITVAASTLDEESKHGGESKFEAHICKNCNLAQWYDYHIVSGSIGPGRLSGKSIYKMPEPAPFRCLNCRGESASTEIISPLTGAGAKEFHGDILVRTCAKCGLAELYEIILSFSGDGWFDVETRADIARAFVCPMCGSGSVDKTGHADFVKILPQRLRIDFLSRSVATFIFCTCRRCRYMALFHTT